MGADRPEPPSDAPPSDSPSSDCAGALAGSAGLAELAAGVIASARHTGTTIGTAESLTGGGIVHALTSVPGASAVVRGALVAYATGVKARALGVSPELLAQRGAVDPDVALAMAEGARGLLGCDLAVATTGVAGPDGVDGKPVGLVFVALSGPQGGTVTRLSLTGSRARIRSDTVAAALRLVQRVLDAEHPFRPVVGQGEYLSLQEAPSMRRDDDSAPA